MADFANGDMIEIIEMESANVQITLFHGSNSVEQIYYQKKSYKGHVNHMPGSKSVFIVAEFQNSDVDEKVYFEFKFRRVD